MNLDHGSRIPNWTSLAGLVIVTALALGIRLYQLGYDPLWLDEAWSLWFAQQSWTYLWTEVPNFEVHPPVFYSLLKVWTNFGVDEFSLRLLPAIFSTACAGLTYLACRIALPGRTSLVAALTAGLFAALHPLQIHYSQEIREYSMFAFSYSLLLTGSVWLAKNVGHAGLSWWGMGRTTNSDHYGFTATLAWFAVTIGGSLCLWSNNTGAIFLAACGLPLAVIILIAVRRHETAAWALYNGLGCALLVLASWAHWIPYLLNQAASLPDDFWIRVDFYRFRRIAGDFLTFAFPGSARLDMIAVLGILPVGLASLGSIDLIRRHAPLGFLFVSSLLLPPLANVGISVILQPIFVTKTLLPVAVPLAILIGFGVHALWNMQRTAASLVMVALAILSAAGAWHYATDDEIDEPWRDVAGVITDSYRDGDVILPLPNFAVFPLRHYLQDSPQLTYRIEQLPGPYPAYNNVGSKAVHGIDLEPSFRKSKGVWLVIRNQPDDSRMTEILAQANRLGHKVLETRMGRLITVYYFSPKSTYPSALF